MDKDNRRLALSPIETCALKKQRSSYSRSDDKANLITVKEGTSLKDAEQILQAQN